MSFNPNIPEISNFLAVSQKQINANFQAINNAFAENHVNLTSNQTMGQHQSLDFRPVNSDPTTGNQSALYNKIVSGVPQLFFRSNTDLTPIQLTNSNLSTVDTGAPTGTQYTFLAGPFTIYIGYIISCANGFTVSLTPSSTLLYVGLSTVLTGSPVGPASTAAPININSNQFTVSYNAAQFFNQSNPPVFKPPTIYYTAIGQ